MRQATGSIPPSDIVEDHRIAEIARASGATDAVDENRMGPGLERVLGDADGLDVVKSLIEAEGAAGASRIGKR